MSISQVVRRLLMVLLLVGLLLGADEKQIEGTWEPSAVRYNGRDVPEAGLKQIKLRIEKGTMVLQAGDKDRPLGSYKLDASKKPCAINLIVAEGEHKGKTKEGI